MSRTLAWMSAVVWMVACGEAPFEVPSGSYGVGTVSTTDETAPDVAALADLTLDIDVASASLGLDEGGTETSFALELIDESAWYRSCATNTATSVGETYALDPSSVTVAGWTLTDAHLSVQCDGTPVVFGGTPYTEFWLSAR